MTRYQELYGRRQYITATAKRSAPPSIDSDKLSRDVEAYLEAGGKVEQLPSHQAPATPRASA